MSHILARILIFVGMYFEHASNELGCSCCWSSHWYGVAIGTVIALLIKR